MKLHPSKRSAGRRRRGLALIEILICSSISAMLLTATAVAFRSSVMAYRDNNDRNILISEGRIAMRRLIQEIRQSDSAGAIADAAVPNAVALFQAGTPVENSGIWLVKSQPDSDDPGIVTSNSATWVYITWAYDSTNFQVTRSRKVGSGGTPVTSVMCSYVQDFKVRLEPDLSAAAKLAGLTTYDQLKPAVVSMSLQNLDANGKMQWAQGSGQVTSRIIDAAVPRKYYGGS